jgi:AcrR family transcriptional regulator
MASREDRKKQITRHRREQILEASVSVFSRLGYDRATIPDIAREAGISVGTIYNYYPSKRDLLTAITNQYVIEPFSTMINQSRAMEDAEFIATIMENRLEFGLENADRFMPLLSEVQRDPELRRKYTERVIQPIMSLMEALVATRIDEGAFNDIEPAVATRAAGGMVIGFLLLYRIEGEKSPIRNIDRKKLAGELTGLLLNGLRKKQ